MHVQHGFAEWVGHARVDVLHLASDHHADDLAKIRPRHGPASDALPVPQHREPVAEGLAFLEEMTDVDDRDAAFAQPADHPEQTFSIPLGETAGGLVQNQHLGLAHQGPGDFHDLLLGNGAAASGGIDGKIVLIQFTERRHRHGAAFFAIQPTPTGGLTTEHDVLLDAQVGCQGQFLVDHLDPALAGMQRVPWNERPSIQFDGACVGEVRAAQHLHQGALSRPVLADQRQHLACVHFQGNATQGPGRPEALLHMPHHQSGSHAVSFLEFAGSAS
jgi:hypothetical protein